MSLHTISDVKSTLLELENLWSQHPELRLGQLIELRNSKQDLFYIEDSKLLDNLKAQIPNSRPL